MPLAARASVAVSAALAALALAATALAIGTSSVAALQVGLAGRGLYSGTIDGELGPATTEAIRKLQRRGQLTVDGVPGDQTRAALGRFGRHSLGDRPLAVRAFGWDVAQLQFLLAWHGFPSGTFDGRFGSHTAGALRRFQRFAGLGPDGVAGGATIAALRGPVPRVPYSLAWPIQAPVTDLFGPRGRRFHAGIDLPAASGLPVGAAAAGRVAFCGWRDGFGNVVSVAHPGGVRTLYAHLSRMDVKLGARVAAGQAIGLVGATGGASGPHLHFEVRVRGAAVDPLTALP